ncbi:hypothetical protein [Haladaptatus sp. NG-WS-4]
MNFKALWKPFLLYTCLLGLLTVGATYLATHAGVFMLVLAGGGLLLVVLGGGTTGPLSASGAEHADEAMMGVEDTGLWPHTYTDTSLRLILLFYGFGVFLWSLIVLVTLRDTLV